jgi:hypothetical protein
VIRPGLGFDFPRVNGLDHEADHSFPSGGEVKKALPSLSVYAFMAWCLDIGKTLPFRVHCFISYQYKVLIRHGFIEPVFYYNPFYKYVNINVFAHFSKICDHNILGPSTK